MSFKTKQWKMASEIAKSSGTTATAKNGDRWNGEIETNGRLYQSKEEPAIHLDFSAAKTTWHKRSLAILLERKLHPMPIAKCSKCGSKNLQDTGSFMVETYKCKDCGEIFCQDSAGIGCGD